MAVQSCWDQGVVAYYCCCCLELNATSVGESGNNERDGWENKGAAICSDVHIDHGRVDRGQDGLGHEIPTRVQMKLKPMVFLATVTIWGAPQELLH